MPQPLIHPGLFDRTIRLQTAAAVQSTSGESSFDWDHATEDTIQAQWFPAGTRETWQAQQRLGSYVEGVYRTYYRDPEPTPDNTRIIGHTGRIFDLKPPSEIGRRYGIDLPVVAHGE